MLHAVLEPEQKVCSGTRVAWNGNNIVFHLLFLITIFSLPTTLLLSEVALDFFAHIHYNGGIMQVCKTLEDIPVEMRQFAGDVFGWCDPVLPIIDRFYKEISQLVIDRSTGDDPRLKDYDETAPAVWRVRVYDSTSRSCFKGLQYFPYVRVTDIPVPTYMKSVKNSYAELFSSRYFRYFDHLFALRQGLAGTSHGQMFLAVLPLDFIEDQPYTAVSYFVNLSTVELKQLSQGKIRDSVKEKVKRALREIGEGTSGTILQVEPVSEKAEPEVRMQRKGDTARFICPECNAYFRTKFTVLPHGTVSTTCTECGATLLVREDGYTDVQRD